MHTDLHSAFALQDQQDRIARATAFRQTREARRLSRPSESRLHGMWDRMSRSSRPDSLLPKVVAFLRPRHHAR